MALSRAVKQQLLEMEIPDDSAIRARVEIFMMKSGYTQFEIAGKIGYSHAALSHFLRGKYDEHWQREGNTLMIRSRLQEFLDRSSFELKPRDFGKAYPTRSSKQIRNAFFKALENGWAYCIDGAPGTQKSYAAEYLVRELARSEADKNGSGRRAYYIYCYPNTSPENLLKMIAIEAGISARGHLDQLIRKVQYEMACHRTLLILDEAQRLPKVTIETVRALLDRPPYIGMLFMGSHELQRIFADLRMEQWKRRLNKIVVLDGLTQEEAENIITSELRTVSQKQINLLIESSTVKDYRKPLPRDGRKPQEFETYISAGELFKSIELLQQKRAESAKGGSDE